MYLEHITVIFPPVIVDLIIPYTVPQKFAVMERCSFFSFELFDKNSDISILFF